MINYQRFSQCPVSRISFMLLVAKLLVLCIPAVANNQQVFERLRIYQEEASRAVNEGNYERGCTILKHSYTLALNEKFDRQVTESLYEAQKVTCEKAASVEKQRNDAIRQATGEFCRRTRPILVDCAAAADIAKCYEIRSGGQSFEQRRFRCGLSD